MPAYALAVRVAVGGACVFASWNALRMAAAEHFEYENTAASHRRALALDSGNEFFIARNAELRGSFGDPSPDVDKELRRAIRMNPRDASALMALGLRTEQIRDAEAANLLERAADVDHTYKPAWTLLNYYFRTGDYVRAWRLAARCLEMIQPRDATVYPYDPAPVFDLLWHMSDDSARILTTIPKKSATLLPYVGWLCSTGRTDAAVEAWPEALRVADLSSNFDTDPLFDLCNYLIGANRSSDAVRVWNALIDHAVVGGTSVDPLAGILVEDGTFRFPPVRMGFGWMLTPDSGEFAVVAWHNLRIDFTGDEPESSRLLFKTLPLTAARQYLLTWNVDGTRIQSSPESAAGLYFRIVDPLTGSEQACPPLTKARACRFAMRSRTSLARLDLLYSRALGSTRLEGAILLSSVDAKPEPGT